MNKSIFFELLSCYIFKFSVFCIILFLSCFMLVLSLISFLSVLNKLIRSICGGGKQARTQGNMIGQEKIDFETNTFVGRH